MNAFEEGLALGRMAVYASKPHLRRFMGWWFCEDPRALAKGATPREAYTRWADTHYRQELVRINREARARLAHAYRQEQFWSLNGMN